MAFLTDAPTHPRQVMLTVMAALAPGTLALLGWYGVAALSNLVVAAVAALLTEVVALRLRQRAPLPVMLDGSAVLTGLLVGLALPPGTPLGIVALVEAIDAIRERMTMVRSAASAAA